MFQKEFIPYRAAQSSRVRPSLLRPVPSRHGNRRQSSTFIETAEQLFVPRAMQAHVEFIFRPRNFIVRFLASLIGAPTCGIIRSGPHMDHYGADYDLAVFFVAPDDKTAELKGLSSPVQLCHFKAIRRAGAAKGLKFRWDRRKAGRIVRIDPQYDLAVAA